MVDIDVEVSVPEDPGVLNVRCVPAWSTKKTEQQAVLGYIMAGPLNGVPAKG